MTITRTIIALTALVALAPSGASAAALYGGGTASVAAPGVSAGASAGAGASSSDSSWVDEAVGIEAPDVSVTAGAAGGADLNTYGESLMAEDANVAEVDAASENQLSVEYYHDGRLFGFIPVKVKSETKAMLDASGGAKIETHMPWWNFFVTGTGDARTMVDEELSGSSQVSADLKMSADTSARARLLAAIVKAHADASVAASAGAE